MQDTWKRLKLWFKSNAPAVDADLLPGASGRDFVSLEKLVGARLPDGFRRVYAIHDGQIGIGPPVLAD